MKGVMADGPRSGIKPEPEPATPAAASAAGSTAFGALGLLLLAAAHTAAQEPACETCLALTPVAELTTADAPIVPSTSQSVIRIRDGSFLVSHQFSGTPQFAVYDTDGDFVELYEETGEGPGEIRSPPRLYPGPSGGVWLWEMGRLIRLDSTLSHVDTRGSEEPITGSRTIHRPDGTVVMDSRTATEDGYFTITIRDSTAAVLDGLEFGRGEYTSAVLARGTDGGFWTLHVNQLVLRRYSDDGELSASVPVALEYFEPWEGAPSGEGVEGFDYPRRAIHTGLVDAGDNLMVVLTRVTDEEWTPIPSNQSFRPAEVDYNRRYDTMVSVVDLRTGWPLVTRRIPERLRIVDGAPDLVYAAIEEPDGHVTTRILRIRAERP